MAEERARRLADDLRDLPAHRLREAERLERRRRPRLVDQPHDDLLALDRGQGRDADVEQPADGRRVERDPAVLWTPALGDVELREHLQAGRDACGHPLRDALLLGEHAVHARPHDQRLALRLEVDVARPVARGLHDDRVHEAHEGRIGDAVLGLEIVAVLLDDLEVVDRRLRVVDLGAALQALELGEDLVTPGDGEVEVVPRGEPELVDREDVRGVRERDEETAVAEGDGNRGNALQRPRRDLLERVTRRTLLLEVDVGKPVAPCERTSDAFRLRVALVDERLGERADAGARLGSGEPIARDDLERADQIGDEIGERREARRRRARSRQPRPTRDACRVPWRSAVVQKASRS